MKTTYRCHFQLKARLHTKNYVYSEEGIGAFKDGFWINRDLQLTKSDDCMFWIPPSQIEYIYKEKKK